MRDWRELKKEALDAGESSRLHRWSMDEADLPEASGAVHIVLGGPGASEAIAVGEAVALPGGRAQLVADWEVPGAISYAWASSKGVASVLAKRGFEVELVEDLG